MNILYCFLVSMLTTTTFAARVTVQLVEGAENQIDVTDTLYVKEAKTANCDVKDSGKVQYAEYVNQILKALERINSTVVSINEIDKIEEANTSDVSKTIASIVSQIGYEKTSELIIEVLNEVKDQDGKIFVILKAFKSVDTRQATSIQLATTMKVLYSKLSSSSNLKKLDNTKNANISDVSEWYQYMDGSYEGGTGLWALIKRAQFKAEKGEDVTDLYNIFMQMIAEDFKQQSTNKEK